MEFNFNEKLGSFDAVVEFRGLNIDIRITNEDKSQLESLATETISFLTSHFSELQSALVDSLHPTYNEDWCDPANGRPQLPEDEFLAKLSPTTIDVEEFEEDEALERSLTLYYDDGRLFGGTPSWYFGPYSLNANHQMSALLVDHIHRTWFHR